MKTQNYKDLTVWQRSMELTRAVYMVTKQLPKSESYVLASQIQRAAISIPSNIAEGYGRNNRKEYVQFLGIANGSVAELETQLLLVIQMYPQLDCQQSLGLLVEVQKMLSVMIKKLKVS